MIEFGQGKEPEKKVMPVTLDGIAYIPNIFDLPKLGAGHDGRVFRYGNLALKLLKYDIPTRAAKNLMTFAKAKYFRDELEPRRFINPYGILLDEDGVYCGYSMEYVEDLAKDPNSPNYKAPSSFTVEDLFCAIEDLEADTEEMTKKKVVMKDLNRGCYLFSSDFMKICDMDKFFIALHQTGIRSINRNSLNFLIAKFFLYELTKKHADDKEHLDIVKKWTVRNIKNPKFIDQTKSELESTSALIIGDYLEEKDRTLIK